MHIKMRVLTIRCSNISGFN